MIHGHCTSCACNCTCIDKSKGLTANRHIMALSVLLDCCSGAIHAAADTMQLLQTATSCTSFCSTWNFMTDDQQVITSDVPVTMEVRLEAEVPYFTMVAVLLGFRAVNKPLPVCTTTNISHTVCRLR